jgi:3-(3-hydroxy-phenyl)propionate hydroxylase
VLLDSYQQERMPHATAVVQMSIMLGRIANTTDPAEAAARDAAFKAGNVPPPPQLPKLAGNLLPVSGPDSPVGSMAPQGRLQTTDGIRRGDDALGYGFKLIATPAAMSTLNGHQQQILKTLSFSTLTVGPRAGDVDGVYSAFLKSAGAEAALLRPDHIVFAATDAASLPSVLDDLAARLHLTPAEAVR